MTNKNALLQKLTFNDVLKAKHDTPIFKCFAKFSRDKIARTNSDR